MANGSPSWRTAATRTATLWLMDGFAAAGNEGWQAPGPLAPGRRRMADHDARRTAAGRSVGPGLPCQLLRGRRVRALERQASADRDGMGSRGARRAAQRRLRHRLAMDPQLLFALSRLPRHRRRARGIQRQVHGQPAGAARLLACNAGRSQPYHLSQFLLSAPPLAIHGIAARRLRPDFIAPNDQSAPESAFRRVS